MILLAASLLVSAAAAAQPMRPGAAELHPCRNPPARSWTGRSASAANIAALQAAAGAGSVRVIRPGERISMDYVTDRLNIEVDRSDRILRAYCG